MKQLFLLVALVSLPFIIVSCKKNETKPEDVETPATPDETPNNLMKLGETFINGSSAKAIVYGTKEPETGYNEIYVALYDSADGSRLSTGHLNVLPMMDMGTMKHSAPVENTNDSTTSNGYFKSAVIFSMPGTASQWWLDVTFTNGKNKRTGAGKLNLAVKSSSPSKFKSTVVAADNNTSLFISFVNPKKPVVGINDFEVVLSKKKNMMEYMPVQDYKIEIEPTMPSMGHGSPNNVNPVLSSQGHYKGKVNFTMSGLWRISLKLFKNDSLVSSDQYFEITVE